MLNRLFGCRHNKLSFPQTVRAGKRRSAVASVTGTYVACLDCGEELPYDWKEMKVVTNTKKYNRALKEQSA